MAKDKMEAFLNLVEIGGGEEFVEREILHELIVFVYEVRGILEAGVGHETDGGVEAFGIAQTVHDDVDLF